MAARKRYRLLITLKSDLCVATGDGFSSGVDTDVCRDSFGLPTIPARRIKGCLREAAELLFEGDPAMAGALFELFGTPGSSRPGSIVVGDAHITGHKSVRAAVASAGLSPERVLAAYSRTLAQTAIEGDTVKPGSLRFTRVVSRWAPGQEDTELTFEAPIEADERFEEVLSCAARALRNIGLRRNRGLGAVRCSLAADDARQDAGDIRISRTGESTRIDYAVRAESTLMIPGAGANESATYIPGSAVLGFFAGRLRDSASFDELFLSDKLTFSPLYPADASGARCVPAPAVLAKIKGGERNGQLVNLATAKIAPNEQPKPLKGGFVGSDWLPVEVATEIVYHHATKKAGQSATLYTQRCISRGQVFTGYIEGPSELVSIVEPILRGGGLYFGRSKTAQYARCSLAPAPAKDALRAISVRAGDTYLALLDSDALIPLEGSYRSDASALKDALSEALGGCMAAADFEQGGRTLSSIRTKVVAGYNAKWNQKRPHVQAIAAGSCIAFVAAEDSQLPAEIRIGDRISEGFGRVLVFEAKTIEPAAGPAGEAASPAAVPDSPITGLLAHERALDEARAKTIRLLESRRGAYAREGASFIGRLTLMAKESTSLADVQARFASIKSEPKRKFAQGLLASLLEEVGEVCWEDAKECLVLMLTSIKYIKKQSEGEA